MILNERPRVSAGVGGALALEFANTAGWHLSAKPSERLCRGADFLLWATEQGLIGKDCAESMSGAEYSLLPVISLREAIFRMNVAAARGQAPMSEDFALLARASSFPLPDAEWVNGRYRWRFRPEAVIDQTLGLIARDAIDLLASERVKRLRICEGGECGWLFLDAGRGKPRRWCSMSDCGNRAKARDAYKRARASLMASRDGAEKA